MKREQVLPHVMADMAVRIAKGADQYGEPLTTNNGRDALQDAYEEALDMCLHLKQALMERAAATFPCVVMGKDGLSVADRESWLASEKNRLAMERGNGWPGPDWSQAPEWAMWWAHAKGYSGGMWANHELGIFGEPPFDSWGFCSPTPDAAKWVHAPSFGYTRGWRYSLRKRPA